MTRRLAATGSRMCAVGFPRRWLVAALAMVVLAACQNIPRAELTAYRAAFNEANAAKDQILVDFAAAIAEAEAYVAIHSKPEPGKDLSPFESSLDDGVEGLDALATRRAAWRVIARYNDALADLAEGKSDEEARSAVGSFGTAVGNFIQAATGSAVPGLAQLVGLAQTVAGVIEEARRAREFKKALRAGAPLVIQILDALHADAGDQYTIRQALARDSFVEGMSGLTTSIGELYQLLAAHDQPAEGVTANGAVEMDGDAYLTDMTERLNTTTLPLANSLVEFPFTLAWADTGGATYTPTAKNTAELRFTDIEKRVTALVALKQEVNGIRDTLNAYRALLGTTKTTLIKLDQALDAPVDVSAEVERILDTVFLIKQGIEKYRIAREQANLTILPAVPPQ